MLIGTRILTIFAGPEGVGKQNQNKQSSDYLEKNWEEEDAPGEVKYYYLGKYWLELANL